jgi:hypothetical protein
MAELVRIDGLGDETLPTFSVAAGETLGEVVMRLGGEIVYTPLPELPADLVHEAKLRERVARLLEECGGDPDRLPAAWAEHESDECLECEAIRLLEQILD